MDLTEIISILIPMVSIVAAVATAFAVKINNMSKKFEDYKNDKFRQSIEAQINELSKELTINKERFSSINHLVKDAQEIYFNDKKNDTYYKEKIKFDFFESLGIKNNIKVDEKLVFVLTPFNQKFQPQYEAIKSTVLKYGFSCSKGDDSNTPDNILPHILEKILSARLIIANISGRNPNVFYELGIAHAIGKPVIIVSESLSEIPFNINQSRIMAFKNEYDLSTKLDRWFVETLLHSH